MNIFHPAEWALVSMYKAIIVGCCNKNVFFIVLFDLSLYDVQNIVAFLVQPLSYIIYLKGLYAFLAFHLLFIQIM